MQLTISHKFRERFPNFTIVSSHLDGLRVRMSDAQLEALIDGAVRELREKYTNLSMIKSHPILSAYRHLLRSTVDPNIDSSVTGLIQRIIKGRPFPKINNVVDACNLALLQTFVAMGVFDTDRIMGEVALRFANKGETFREMGKDRVTVLRGGEVVIADAEKVFSIPTYRDAEETKTSDTTQGVLLFVMGVEEVETRAAAKLATQYIGLFCY